MHCIDIDIDYSTFHLFEYRSITLDALLLFAICLHPSVLSFMLFQCALFAQPLTCFTFCHLSIQRLQQCSHIEFLALSLSLCPLILRISSFFECLIHLVFFLIGSCYVQRHSIHGMMEEENVIRPHQEIQALNFEEKKFLLAVERGDVAGTRR